MNNSSMLLKQMVTPLINFTNHRPFALLRPSDVEYVFNEKTQKVRTKGLGVLDQIEKDLIELILIENTLEAKYHGIGICAPRTFAESLPVIPHHVTTQAVFISIATTSTGCDIHSLTQKYDYGFGSHDKLWLETRNPTEVLEGEVIMLMNRRIGGWDGSLTNPVIELLCAGGHVPVYWKSECEKFHSQSPEETLEREIEEEVGLKSSDYTMKKIGGFFNIQTSELVILYGVIVSWENVLKMQSNAYGNLSENINGLYLGTFDFVIDSYLRDASSFAGGEKVKPTNFPSQNELMKRIKDMIENRSFL